ncbi:MAG: TRAP transporter small permease subunit [Methylococcales bacterium]|jgi:TRAP-type mannitol/chloroaromatic compound transport system permease small subunit|nr:TRAP transporter small permease subunit [Methylococcaceae bacterium]HIL39514.1 TRAP transporter small permease subunit [Methylococcales bacterium]
MNSFVTIGQCAITLIDTLNERIGRGVSWLTLAIVLVTVAVVIFRYCFNLGSIAAQESISYMHALIFMLGAAYTLKHNAHVRVDIFHHRFSKTTQGWVDFLGTLLLLMPVCLFIIISSWGYVSDSWGIQESSRNSGGLPGVYLLKSTIIIMAGLLFLQGISLAIKSLFSALGITPNTES